MSWHCLVDKKAKGGRCVSSEGLACDTQHVVTKHRAKDAVWRSPMMWAKWVSQVQKSGIHISCYYTP